MENNRTGTYYGFDHKNQRHATERIRFQQGARQRKKSLEL